MSVKRIAFSILSVAVLMVLLVYIKIVNENIENNVCEIQNISNLDSINFRKFNSVKLSASNAYKSDGFKNFLQGKNYRAAWETVVDVPILYLDTLYGGVKVIKQGGGQQTKSLRLANDEGLILTLRSINKNPKPLVPDAIEKLGLSNMVTDGISGQHPYAAIVVSKLADATGVLHTNPNVVYVPKQPTLGEKYNFSYGNKIYLLEYENKGNVNWSKFEDVEMILDNDGLQKRNTSAFGSIKIDKAQLIRSRLFDIVIGDWDRHAKQWGWLLQKKDTTYSAIPFPMDRDNAFFNVEGVLPSLISNKNITPHLQSFSSDIEFMGLVYDFDIYYLQGTTQKDFITEAKKIQNLLTDKKIEDAFKVWNKDLYQQDAKRLIKTIKKRRNNLLETAKEFKRVLDNRPLLKKPLRGSDIEDTALSSIKCFEC